ncbi:MAG: hypothetical protein GF350_01890 [Chitinivibrionales bacterium]|nr:hypothetical protein [Chitinivibrionales bacterium]
MNRRTVYYAHCTILAALVVMTGCAAKNKTAARLTIPAQHEKIFLKTLDNKAAIEAVGGWPGNESEQKILSALFTQIHEKLEIEFRRCEKYGLYELTQDPLEATLYVTVTLEGHSFVSNTLKIPVTVTVYHAARNKRFSFSLSALAHAPDSEVSGSDFHTLGLLLGNLHRNFPYKKIVSFFYPAESYKEE